VQTAKHYGNLGRLYQSMRRYEVNETKIKQHSVYIIQLKGSRISLLSLPGWVHCRETQLITSINLLALFKSVPGWAHCR